MVDDLPSRAMEASQSLLASPTRWVDVGRSVGLMTARTGKLLDLYGADVLATAVADVLARGH
jgi:hypothetical protein